MMVAFSAKVAMRRGDRRNQGAGSASGNEQSADASALAAATRRFVGRLSLACAFSIATGIAPAQAQNFTIATLDLVFTLPFHVAVQQRFFAAEGIEVQLLECPSGPACFKLMYEGRAQMATSALLPVVFDSFAGKDLVVVASIATSSNDIKLVVRKSSGIKTLADLVGKRVGTTKGTALHYFLDSQLIYSGIEPKGVNLVPMAPGQLTQALKDHAVDAATNAEPAAHLALKALGDDGAVLPGERTFTLNISLVATRVQIAEREADMVKVLRALERAQRWIHDEPAKAQALLMSHYKVDQSFVDANWKNYTYRMGLDQSVVSSLEAQARWAVREGHAPAGSKVPNYLAFVSPGPLRKAVPLAIVLSK